MRSWTHRCCVVVVVVDMLPWSYFCCCSAHLRPRHMARPLRLHLLPASARWVRISRGRSRFDLVAYWRSTPDRAWKLHKVQGVQPDGVTAQTNNPPSTAQNARPEPRV